jgi:sulfoxide reductase heme-binding subunit YedZ
VIGIPLAVAPSTWWYLSRAGGAITLFLLTATVVLGIVDFSRWNSERWPRFVIDGLHRNVSILALVTLSIHILAVMLDTFAPINLKDAVIPFASAYRPIWLGMGALAFDLLLALALTSLARRRLGYSAWRAVHWAAYACWPLALLHGLGTGTDTPSLWMLGLTGACLASVVVAVGWRISTSRPDRLGRRKLAMAVLTVGPVLLLAWMFEGPLASGWAGRAGTPPSLLASVASSAPQASGTVAVPAATPANLQVPFDASLSGTIKQTPGPGSGLVSVDLPMTVSGGASGLLDVRIVGQPLGGGGVSMLRSAVTLGPPGQPQAYTGRVLALRGTRLAASVSPATGAPVALDITLSIDEANRSVGGSVHAQPGSQVH